MNADATTGTVKRERATVDIGRSGLADLQAIATRDKRTMKAIIALWLERDRKENPEFWAERDKRHSPGT